MTLDVARSDCFASTIVDLEVGLDVSFEKAADLTTMLYDELDANLTKFTDAIYGVDGSANAKNASAVAVTLMTLATRLMIAKRMSVRAAVAEAKSAVRSAVDHAREVERRKMAEKHETNTTAHQTAA